MTASQKVNYEVQDEEGILYDVTIAKNGSVTGKVRVCGHVEIDGGIRGTRQYAYDKHILVRLLPV